MFVSRMVGAVRRLQNRLFAGASLDRSRKA
jgi:hypothetical protein